MASTVSRTAVTIALLVFSRLIAADDNSTSSDLDKAKLEAQQLENEGLRATNEGLRITNEKAKHDLAKDAISLTAAKPGTTTFGANSLDHYASFDAMNALLQIGGKIHTSIDYIIGIGDSPPGSTDECLATNKTTTPTILVTDKDASANLVYRGRDTLKLISFYGERLTEHHARIEQVMDQIAHPPPASTRSELLLSAAGIGPTISAVSSLVASTRPDISFSSASIPSDLFQLYQGILCGAASVEANNRSPCHPVSAADAQKNAVVRTSVKVNYIFPGLSGVGIQDPLQTPIGDLRDKLDALRDVIRKAEKVASNIPKVDEKDAPIKEQLDAETSNARESVKTVENFFIALYSIPEKGGDSLYTQISDATRIRDELACSAKAYTAVLHFATVGASTVTRSATLWANPKASEQYSLLITGVVLNSYGKVIGTFAQGEQGGNSIPLKFETRQPISRSGRP